MCSSCWPGEPIFEELQILLHPELPPCGGSFHPREKLIERSPTTMPLGGPTQVCWRYHIVPPKSNMIYTPYKIEYFFMQDSNATESIHDKLYLLIIILILSSFMLYQHTWIAYKRTATLDIIALNMSLSPWHSIFTLACVLLIIQIKLEA